MADENEIYLYGTVGAQFWGEDCFTAGDVREMLMGRTGRLTARINSGGGVATEGQAIYTMLRDYPDGVDVVIDGVAASAASLIAMAGDTITMRLGAFMMIHDPAQDFTEGRGTEDEHLRLAKALRTMSQGYAAIYADKAGLTVDEARAVMKTETFYEAEEAVEAGFADVFEGDVASSAAAQFDYRIYANAPASLLRSKSAVRKRNSKQAVLAMIAGVPAEPPKGKTMKSKAKITAMDEDDQTVAAADMAADDEIEKDEDPVDAAVDDNGIEIDGDEQDEDEDTPVAVQIMDLCTSQDLSMEFARDLIARNVTLSQAVTAITAKQKKENPLNGKPRMGRPAAPNSPDSRAGRRVAMRDALTAQITGAATVSAAARPFMGMSIVEMAATCIDHRGPMRNAGQRQDVLMQASHSTSDFPGIFENALGKVLLERYEMAEPTYRQISRARNFTDFRAAPLVRAGDFPRLQPVGENGEIKFGTFGESREVAALAPYAVGLRISRQMMVNDELGAIDELLGDYGNAVAGFEEETFYKFFLAAKLSDGVNLFHATRKNLAAAGTAITIDAVSAGRAAIRKQRSIPAKAGEEGKNLNLNPSILLVGPEQETAAEQLVAAVQPQEAGKVNPFSGKLTVVVTPEITNKAWYLLAAAERAGGACFVHGFLDGASAPRFRTEDTFGTQGMAFTLEHDFGLGASDYRGGYKNPGE